MFQSPFHIYDDWCGYLSQETDVSHKEKDQIVTSFLGQSNGTIYRLVAAFTASGGAEDLSHSVPPRC
jgi:hypothetical protein